jgi:N-acetylmuramoyl-L-alanine amidase
MENRDVLAKNRFDDYLAETGIDNENILPIDQSHDNIGFLEYPGILENSGRSVESSDNIIEETIGQSLIFELGSADTNFLTIPVPAGTGLMDIEITNHYLDNEMRIVIRGISDINFYARNVISGNRKNITAGSYEIAGTNVILKFSLDNIYEYHSIMEDNKIYIEFVPPREIFDRIIVIDPAFGGNDSGIIANELKEKDVVLSIATKLKELLDQTDIKVYYTRLYDSNNPSDEKRVRIANNTRADMLIRIQVDSNDDSMVNGTTAIYNESFFIPRFGSIELANILEREVVLSIRGRAVGLKPATALDYVISNATVPAAAIKVGYLTNAQEAILLGRDDYLEKIAVGIFNAIMAVYEP